MPITVNEKGGLIAPTLAHGNLRSEAMNEIISRRPGFLAQWALLIFVFILLTLVAGTWFVHYPDAIRTRATLIATNAPKGIVVQQEGRLIRLFVKNNDSVSAGATIGCIESNAQYNQVLLLSAFLDTAIANLQKDNMQFTASRFGYDFEGLGELQTGYQQFAVAYQQFIAYLHDGFYVKRKNVLGEDLAFLRRNHEIIQQQKELMLKDLNLSEENYKANELLLKQRVISKQDDRNEHSKLLSKQLGIPQINSSLLSNETQQREKLKEISELEYTTSQQKLIFQQNALTFQNLVNEWIRKYVLKATISGKIAFVAPFQENQYLKAGTLLGFVNPPESSYYAEVNLPQYNFGKIETGQPVQLSFDAYPYQEFGYVKGKLGYISEFATDSGFLAHVQLTDGLVTDRQRTIHYRDGLKAEVQIITKDMRLLERFYNNILRGVIR